MTEARAFSDAMFWVYQQLFVCVFKINVNVHITKATVHVVYG